MPFSKNSAPISINTIPEHIKYLLLDVDGVIFLQSKLIHENIPQILSDLREKRGIEIVFVTNNSTKSREEYKEKMHQMGLLWVKKEDIIVSGYLAAVWLQENYVKSIYLIGEKGLQKEIEEHNIRVRRHEDVHKFLSLNESEVAQIPEEELSQIEYVVIGWDREFTFYKLCYAVLCLQQKRDIPCGFIATNKDSYDKVDDFKNIPGSGAMVGSVEAATGIHAKVIGKPNTFAIELLEKTRGWTRENMLMVGDRLDSDIEMANKGNIDSLLVFSGTTTEELLSKELNKEGEATIPTYTISGLSSLQI